MHPHFRSLSPSSAVSETLSVVSRSNSSPRPTSPSPSVVSEKAEAELQVQGVYLSDKYCLPLVGGQLSGPREHDKRAGSGVKVKVKVTVEQATKAQKGSRGMALLFL